MPYQQVANPNDPNKCLTINYKYRHNGKLSSSETSHKGVTIQESKYNKQGKLEEKITYNNKGEFQSKSKYKYNKDNSVVISKYNKADKLLNITTEQYNDNKRVASETRDADNNILQECTFDTNGKIHTAKQYYTNGQLKADTEYWDNGVIKEQSQFDENGKITKRISAQIDGNFGESSQISEGDCYLLSTINSIRNLTNGQEILKNLVNISTDKNGEKTYTVTLPGAQVAAEGLKHDSRINPEKMHITGTYTFTENEMQEVLKQAGKKYSLGDGDIILLEATFEKYRKEVEKTLTDNGIDPKKVKVGEAGLLTGLNSENILAGGKPEDSAFILTGRVADDLFIDGKTQYGLNYEALLQGNIEISAPKKAINEGENTKAINEVGKITSNRKKLDNMLDKIMNDPNDGKVNLVASASFATVQDNGKVGGHAFTIKSVTKDTVTLINPWHPNKEITMSRADFLKSAKMLSINDINKKPVTVEDVQNGNAPVTPQTPNNTSNPTTNPTISTNTQTNNSNIYPVEPGDNLWKIARKALGKQASNKEIANFVEKIITANPQLKSNPNLIFVKQKIIIPSINN